MPIENYLHVSKLHESHNSLVFRARERGSERPVVLKYLKQEYPSAGEIARYRREYEIMSGLDIPEVVRVYEQIRDRNSLVLVVEDFGGESLAMLMDKRRIPMLEALALGIRIAEALAKIHAARVIHMDLNPSNIVQNQDTDVLKIIDFGIATRLPRQVNSFVNPDRLEGTIAYMSPEQTGRMNRSIDYRTDFYSLGVTLYELLSGQRPFADEEALRLLHSHIAVPPRPLHEVAPEVPEAVAEIVMKLLEKNAEDRYRSGWGIASDLRRCQEALTQGGRLLPFELGRDDTSMHLEVSQKLYGRESELMTLLQVFGRASQGPAQMMLISGYSGIGKTSLVQEIHRPITYARGYYAAGKFDQLGHVPYSALSDALTALVRQLLTESEASLARWRQRLLRALGMDGQVLLDLLPELVNIIGPQRPVEELPPTETNLRLRRILSAFLAVFADPAHPLVLFIDDLQWADSLSLALLEAVLCEGRIVGLLVIGAYRDNEIDALHPLTAMRTALKAHGEVLHEISLPNLSHLHVRDLLSATLGAKGEDTADLAELIKSKTAGNPFFIQQLLKAMYDDGLLWVEASDGAGHLRWRWSMSAVAAFGITENVVDLLLKKLRLLPGETQTSLKRAASLGNQFDLKTLALVGETSLIETYATLHAAAQAGFILPTSEAVTIESEGGALALVVMNYRFLHDRVQQAAYALILDEDRRSLHTKIGRLMLGSFAEEERERRLFELVDHLNRGEKPNEHAAQIELARLNLHAASKAKQATAFDASRLYIEEAQSAMPADIWETDRTLAMAICTLHIDVASISSHHDFAEQLAQRTLLRTDDVLERGRIQCTLINQRSTVGKYPESIALGIEALGCLGVDIPRDNIMDILQAEHAQIMQALEDRGGVASLIELPTCQDPKDELAFVLLSSLVAPCYEIGSPLLMNAVCSRIILRTLSHGLHPEAVMGFSAYAIWLGMAFQQYTLGYEMGNFAFKIAERFSDRRQLCRATNVVVAFLAHWARSYAPNNELVRRGVQAGLEVAELQYTSYLVAHHAMNCWASGEPLHDLSVRVGDYLKHMARTKVSISSKQLAALELLIRDAREQADPQAESAFLQLCGEGQSPMPICQFRILKAQLHYYGREYEPALGLLDQAKDSLAFIPGASTMGEYYYYRCLTLCALYEGVGDARRDEIDALLKQMEVYASHCPANFGQKVALIRAELAAIEGRPWDAIESYERAIELATASAMIQDQALAQYRTSLFWARHGKGHLSDIYLRESHQSLVAWGALRFARGLEQAAPWLLSRASMTNKGRTITTTTTLDAAGSTLDLGRVIRASRAISGAKDLDTLLSTIMEICLESAGASRGTLVLSRLGKLVAKVRGEWSTPPRIELISNEIDEIDELSHGIVYYVARTGEALVLEDASSAGAFTEDPYVKRSAARSVLCLPLLHQGTLLGVVFMENPEVAAAFTNDHLDIIRLLLTPAAVTIENMLLKNEREGAFVYQVGGSLPAGSHSYVTRRADRDLQNAIRAGLFCYVLCPRQMGKSSLRVHTMQRLMEQDYVCAAIDLSVIGSRTITPEQWYAGVARGLLVDLGLSAVVELRKWWREHDHLSPSHRLVELFEREILTRIDRRIVVFVDEIDSVLSLGFDYDDFFAMIRGFFNRRVDDARFERLSFVLLGVASPPNLVRDASRTPFNVGHSVKLEQFTALECKPLLAGFAQMSDPEMIIKAVLSWTSGQPFLTQRICSILVNLETTPRPGQESAWVGRAVRNKVIERWESQDEPTHFRTIQERIVRSPHREQLLRLYAEILDEKRSVAVTGDSIQVELLLTGLVIEAEDRLQVASRIYEEIFRPSLLAKISSGGSP